MDEFGQVDLIVDVAALGGLVAQRGGQGPDLLDGIVGQAHEIPQGQTDDGIQGDQNGEGKERPQAAGRGVDALSGVEIGHFLLLPLLVVGVTGLDVLDLALQAVHPQHALLALELEGQ